MDAEVLINPKRIIHKVSPGIYGSFIENLGACIYGGVYDPESPMADEDGFRRDVMETARKMGVTSVRFRAAAMRLITILRTESARKKNVRRRGTGRTMIIPTIPLERMSISNGAAR